MFRRTATYEPIAVILDIPITTTPSLQGQKIHTGIEGKDRWLLPRLNYTRDNGMKGDNEEGECENDETRDAWWGGVQQGLTSL